jgi:hypothetical protein
MLKHFFFRESWMDLVPITLLATPPVRRWFLSLRYSL